MQSTYKILSGVTAVVGSMALATSTYGAMKGDTAEIAELRAQFEKAVIANDPEAVGKLVTDDYVMLQPNPKGPDTYGREAYVNYRKSLDTVTKLTVEPVRVISCGKEWAFEISKEHMEWDLTEVPGYPTHARVVKVLNRNDNGEWRYARTIRAWDTTSHVAPPAPGSLSNAGYGVWEPRRQGAAETKRAQEMMDMQHKTTRALVASGDMSSMMDDVLTLPDENLGDMIAYGAGWEMTSREEYLENRPHANMTPYDDLRKYFEEGISCEKGMGFVWGQDITTGSSRVDGKRWISSGDFFYIMTKQEGRWRMGPVGALYNEVPGEDY